MKEKNIILTARIMSMLFTPFYLPLVGLVALFLFSYMSLLPLAYKLPMLLTVYLSISTADTRDGAPPNWARKSDASCPTSSPSCATLGAFS